jgi:hypothetical protein
MCAVAEAVYEFLDVLVKDGVVRDVVMVRNFSVQAWPIPRGQVGFYAERRQPELRSSPA